MVQRAAAAVRGLGLLPNVRVTNGGLDANWMARHGVPTATFGAGQYEIHTVNEYVDLDEFEAAVQLAYALGHGVTAHAGGPSPGGNLAGRRRPRPRCRRRFGVAGQVRSCISTVSSWMRSLRTLTVSVSVVFCRTNSSSRAVWAAASRGEVLAVAGVGLGVRLIAVGLAGLRQEDHRRGVGRPGG